MRGKAQPEPARPCILKLVTIATPSLSDRKTNARLINSAHVFTNAENFVKVSLAHSEVIDLVKIIKKRINISKIYRYSPLGRQAMAKLRGGSSYPRVQQASGA